MRCLVRIYTPQRDKANIWKDTFEEGLELLGKTEEDIAQRVEWLGNVDVFFNGTNNYIRINNKI